MNKKKKIALWVIAALQFNATIYFVLLFALEGRGVTLFGIPLANLGPNQGVQVVGLILGVVLGWMALRMSLQRAERAETALRHCTVQFADVLEEHFRDWRLTPAERDVAVFLIKGLNTRAIAEMRGTSEGTIKAQTNAIYRKAGVAGRAQLLSLFIEDLMDDTLMPGPKPQLPLAA
ncbi:helix-turn-helix transcriptional regulator [Sulfitobacter sp. S0837]|uniref:helix-turn-helix transcriptional regulator n=1 Tax=Sulfitobacter maritimus TaxID=2741719 RepID=UPI001583C33F|nr:helix-turn-helix transcriptional regulator [Sulfitobacter maritimus]NUH65066.1 helix-turn-helix transcriptional regulator [Sulfitobacter maritimus]